MSAFGRTPAGHRLLPPAAAVALLAAGLAAGIAAGLACSPPAPKTARVDFEDERDLDRLVWNCRSRALRVEEHASSGNWSLHCWFPEIDYPGISFRDFPTDWSEAGTLSFDFYNPSPDTLTVVVRVDDEDATSEHSDRFNQSFPAPPGQTTVLVPMATVALGPDTRELDLARIKRFLIFLNHPGRPVDFHIDNIELR